MEKKQAIVPSIGKNKVTSAAGVQKIKRPDVLDSAMRVLRVQHPLVADLLDTVWGSPAGEAYLARLLKSGRNPDDDDAVPFSAEVMENIVTLSDFHLVDNTKPSNKPADVEKNSGESRKSPSPNDVLLERRKFPRKMASDQVEVIEKNSESVWAAFNQIFQGKVDLKKPNVQKYPTILEQPVDESGQSLGSASAASAYDQRANQAAQALPPAVQEPQKPQKPQKPPVFESTQPMTEELLSQSSAEHAALAPKEQAPKENSFDFSFAQSDADQKNAALAEIGRLHPKIAQGIAQLWGQPACVEYLQQLVFDGYDHADNRSRVGFKTEVISAIMTLMTLHPDD